MRSCSVVITPAATISLKGEMLKNYIDIKNCAKTGLDKSDILEKKKFVAISIS
jgi:hypothetical protein